MLKPKICRGYCLIHCIFVWRRICEILSLIFVGMLFYIEQENRKVMTRRNPNRKDIKEMIIDAVLGRLSGSTGYLTY